MPNQGINIGPFWNNGPSAGNLYNFPANVKNSSVANSDFGVQRNA
jgi:hypothetical protein